MKNNAFMSEVVNGENPNPNDNIFAGVVSREKSGNQEVRRSSYRRVKVLRELRSKTCIN